MRRLFSSFAGGAPGVGLVLLRLAGATILILSATAAPWRTLEFPELLLQACSMGLGVLLVAGLWTPLVATLATVDALITGFSHPTSARYWLVAVICAALALLGPGA